MANMGLLARLRPQISLWELIAALNPFGGSVGSFEKAFANKFNNNYGVMFSHGRAGLYSLFKAWDLKNDEVGDDEPDALELGQEIAFDVRRQHTKRVARAELHARAGTGFRYIGRWPLRVLHG